MASPRGCDQFSWGARASWAQFAAYHRFVATDASGKRARVVEASVKKIRVQALYAGTFAASRKAYPQRRVFIRICSRCPDAEDKRAELDCWRLARTVSSCG